MTGLLSKNPSLWSDDDFVQEQIAGRLGWVNVPESMLTMVNDITSLVNQVRVDGFETAVLLGMGGSSLCPAVLARIFDQAEGYLKLEVMDTTDPTAIEMLGDRIDLQKSIFIISSKSGTTVEPLTLFEYFWEKVGKIVERPGRHFIAITDDATPLMETAREKRFRAILSNPVDIGGRYSALSYFGLLPAALTGINITSLLEKAMALRDRCRAELDLCLPFEMGSLMAEQAQAGRDKLTLITSKRLRPFGLWVEQLIAESTGKQEKGVIPITGEELLAADEYGDDRFFVVIELKGDEKIPRRWKKSLQDQGFELYRLKIDDIYELGEQFWLWEAATAVCGHVLGINPFDEPNVTESKNNTSRLIKDYQETGHLQKEETDAQKGAVSLKLGRGVVDRIKGYLEDRGKAIDDAGDIIQAYLAGISRGEYLVFQVYFPETEIVNETFGRLRTKLTKALKAAVTPGYGPRYLHSTGQEHKGGPAAGVFIQLTYGEKPVIKVPDMGYSFGVLEDAQAAGDFRAIEDHNRPIIGIELESISETGLEELERLFDMALTG